MRYLAYYSNEDKRHADLLERPLTESNAKTALSELSMLFDVSLKEVCFKFQGSTSSASTDGVITFASEMMNWLTLAHEFAHLVHFKMNKCFRGIPRGLKCHDSMHAFITDFVCVIIRSEGWAND